MPTKKTETELLQKARSVKAMIFDVDGVMTDGSIMYDSLGNELKTFCVKDGLGIKRLRQAGIKVAIITGRDSTIVERRAAELGIKDLLQGREDKLDASLELSELWGIEIQDIAYMGDDLPDLTAIESLGFGITVSDAIESVKNAADLVCANPGGKGAVREACEFILDARNTLATTLSDNITRS